MKKVCDLSLIIKPLVLKKTRKLIMVSSKSRLGGHCSITSDNTDRPAKKSTDSSDVEKLFVSLPSIQYIT